MTSGGLLTVHDTVAHVNSALLSMPGCEASFLDDGDLRLWFGDERAAYISDAFPDEGTDISLKDWSGEIGSQIFDYLTVHLNASMELTNDGYELYEHTYQSHRLHPRRIRPPESRQLIVTVQP